MDFSTILSWEEICSRPDNPEMGDDLAVSWLALSPPVSNNKATNIMTLKLGLFILFIKWSMVDHVNLLTDEPEQLGLFSHHWITKDNAVCAGRHHPDPPPKSVEPTPPRCCKCCSTESLSYQPLWALPQLEGAQGCACILAGTHPMTQQLGGTKVWPLGSDSHPLKGHVSFKLPVELFSTSFEAVSQLDFNLLPNFTSLTSLLGVLIPRGLPHYLPACKSSFQSQLPGEPRLWQPPHFILYCWVDTYRPSESSLLARELQTIY